MATYTQRPNGTSTSTGWTNTGGAGSFHAATSDDSDTTYALSPGATDTSALVLDIQSFTVQSNATIKSLTLRLRLRSNSGTAGLASLLRALLVDATIPATSSTIYVQSLATGWDTTITTVTVTTWTTAPDGTAWTQATFDRVLLSLARDTPSEDSIRLYEAYADILINERPNSTRTIDTLTTTSGSATVTIPANTNYYQKFRPEDVGRSITGTGIPANTTISAYVSATQVTLSANASASGTITATVGTVNWVTGPTEGGTVTTTTRPTVTWTYNDPEGDTQDKYYIKIFRQPAGGWGSFDPNTNTSELVWSEELTSVATSRQIQVDLPNATYRAYVKVSDQGGAYSDWDYNTFTMSVASPTRPRIVATAQPTNSDGPRTKLDVYARDNMLTANQSSLETDTTGWQVHTNCTIARVTTQFFHGIAALSMTATGAGNIDARTPTGLSGVAVTPGLSYSASAWLKAATVARTTEILLRFYDSTGAQVASTQVLGTDKTTGWTPVTVTATAPATAAFAAIIVGAQGTAGAGEIHYVDAVSLVPGPQAPMGLFITSTGTLNASIPQSADMQFVGDLEVVAKIRPEQLASASPYTIVGRYTGVAATTQFMLQKNAAGNLLLYYSTGGSVLNATSTVTLASVGLTDEQAFFVKATRNPTTGTIQFWYSTQTTNDESQVSWTQLGANVAGTAGALSNGSTTPMYIGASGGNTDIFLGVISRVVVRSVIGGTKVLDVNFTDESQGWDVGDTNAATGTDSTGKTVTLNGTATTVFIGPDFTVGGTITDRIYVEYNDSTATDTDTNWKRVRGGYTASVTNGVAFTIYDYESAPNLPRYYRARAVDVVSSSEISSEYSHQSATVSFTDWWLKVPGSTTYNFSPDFYGDTFTRKKKEEVTHFEPVGRATPVLVRGIVRKEELILPFEFITYAKWQQFEAIRNLQTTLLLQRGYTNEQWYIQFGGDRDIIEGGYDPNHKRVTMDAYEVDMPATS